MQDCVNCGAKLAADVTHCHICRQPTPFQKKQRHCLACGTPAAAETEFCVMCGHRVDALPRPDAVFGLSWLGIAVGVMLTVAVSLLLWRFQPTLAGGSGSPPTAGPTLPPATPTRQLVIADTATPTQTPIPTSTAVPPTPTPTPLIHQIKQGDSLSLIASRYNVTVRDIQRTNGLNDRSILKIDQELIIPLGPGVPGSIVKDGQTVITYTVRSGDTISGISGRYDTSMEAIAEVNPELDLDILSIDQVLFIPVGDIVERPTPTPTATFTPAPPFVAPNLLLPRDGASFEGAESILLTWASTALLEADQVYVLFLSDDAGTRHTFETQGSSYRLPPDLRPTQPTTFTWQVQIMQHRGFDAQERAIMEPLSHPSRRRSFSWR